MLTFKKGSYTLKDLVVLHDALGAGRRAICIGFTDGKVCHDCYCHKACNDLFAINLYISKLISQQTGKYSNYRNQEIKGGE